MIVSTFEEIEIKTCCESTMNKTTSLMKLEVKKLTKNAFFF